MKHLSTRCFFIALILLSFSYPAFSYQINVPQAGYVYAGSPNTNYYPGSVLHVENNYETYFELPIYGNGITVYLNIYVDSASSCTSECYNLYSTSAFNELTLTYNNMPSKTLIGTLVVSGTGWKNLTIVNPPQYIAMAGGAMSMTIEGTSNVNKPYVVAGAGWEPNYTNINSILFSATSDYNSTISTSNINNSFYVTTFINDTLWDSSWSWYGWLTGNEFYVYLTDPEGGDSSVQFIHQQSGYQLLSEYPKLYGILGNYTYKIKRMYSDEIVAQSVITITNNTGSTQNPNYSIKFIPDNSSTSNITLNSKTPTNAMVQLDFRPYNITLGENWTLYTGSPFNLGNIEYIEAGNYTYNMQSVLSIFSLDILVRARLCKDYNIDGCLYSADATDYLYYHPSNTTPPIIPPVVTPINTPNQSNITPAPTFQPPNNTNYTSYNGTGLNDTTDYMESVANGTLNSINSGSIVINTQIQYYDYSKSKSVFSYFLPAIFNMLPAKLWGIIILGWALEVSLIFLRR